MAAASSINSPCAACKLLRRRCSQDCVFAPYFPADDPHKFASVHKVFGASNVNKMLQELAEDQRGDAVSAMVYEAYARVRDPVYGCAGAISSLQNQLDILQSQLAIAQAQVAHLRINSSQSHSHSHSSINNINIHSNNNHGPPPPDHHHQTNPSSTSSTSTSRNHRQLQAIAHFTADHTTLMHPDMNSTIGGDYSLW